MPKLLDLYCGAGGASMGYYNAGYDVVGVDINHQSRYPFEFIQSDVFEFLRTYDLREFDVIHASPPCQLYSALNWVHKKDYPDHIERLRFLLIQLEKPYFIENVMHSPLNCSSLMLCGTMFDLKVQRHRLFESNIRGIVQPVHHKHELKVVNGDMFSIVGNGGSFTIKEAREAMGIDWMIKKEITQAIPPKYTEYIGNQLLKMRGSVFMSNLIQW
jgi:DNA (cytosine-5)-methyltransferase 1